MYDADHAAALAATVDCSGSRPRPQEAFGQSKVEREIEGFESEILES